jgi:hypothetical protein
MYIIVKISSPLLQETFKITGVALSSPDKTIYVGLELRE